MMLRSLRLGCGGRLKQWKTFKRRMICAIWKGFVLQCLNHAYVAPIPQSPGIGALRWDERIFCCGFHHTCPSLLCTVCTDRAPASPKTSNPDTTILYAPVMSPFQTTGQALFLLVMFVTLSASLQLRKIQSRYTCAETSGIWCLTCKTCPKSASKTAMLHFQDSLI